MKSILFIDDEVNILNGLKRMLNSKKKEWHMVFVLSGEEALGKLAAHSFDIVISDMRMPSMNGAQLLTTIRDKYPSVTRIALSGYSDTQMILESIKSTHLFISKPTDFETLSDAIERCLSIQALISDAELCNFISGINSLPCVPDIYNELVRELSSEDASINSIGRIIEKDISISVKLLQIVNSAFFGLARKVSSPTEAASHLGTDIIKSLVLSIKIFEVFDDDFTAKKANMTFSHSQIVAKAGIAIAKSEGFTQKECDVLMSASLLQDVGKLVIYNFFPKQLQEQFDSHLEVGLALELELERKIFGVSHEQIGAYLLHLWGLPLPVVECVAYHQGREEPVNFEKLTILDILYLSNLIISENYGQPLPNIICDNERFKKYSEMIAQNST